MTLEDLFNVLHCGEFSCFFSVFSENSYEIRYKVPVFQDINALIDHVHSKILIKGESCINSDDFNILEAEFIDCYYTLINE